MRSLLMREAPEWARSIPTFILFVVALEIRAFYPTGFACDFLNFSVSVFSLILFLNVFGSRGKHVRLRRFTAETLRSIFIKFVFSIIVGFAIAVVFLLSGR